ncbi:MAG: penicillin-insensitive murein endopeptidase [Nannocystaceae bacterium]|nr:penicillin-insensitive murein endopeptidase [Nannocystaceae bacterium]
MLDGWTLAYALATGWLRSLAALDWSALASVTAADGAAVEATVAATTTSEDALLLVEDTDALFVDHDDGPLIEHFETPRWIVHRVRPSETPSRIAARYGVAVDKLMRWNRLDPNAGLGRRHHLRVLTDRAPPPLRKIQTTVRAGETWDDLAARLRTDEHGLRTLNWRMRTPVTGADVVAWIDPIEAPSFAPPAQAPSIAPLELSRDGRSIGTPQRGKLEDAVPLPEHPLWVRGNPDHLYGSAHAITTLHRAFTILRAEQGYGAGLLIGAISRERGGRFAPHRSHQSGRDIDIRLPLRPGTRVTLEPTPDEIDWYATWALIESFEQTGELEVVFLNEAHHERLYRAARAMGVSRERALEFVRWPTWAPVTPLVQHAEGHNAHLHVRVRCGPSEPKCE